MKTVRPAKGKAVRAGGKPAIAKPARPLTHAEVPVAHRSSKTPQRQSGTTLYVPTKPKF